MGDTRDDEARPADSIAVTSGDRAAEPPASTPARPTLDDAFAGASATIVEAPPDHPIGDQPIDDRTSAQTGERATVHDPHALASTLDTHRGEEIRAAVEQHDTGRKERTTLDDVQTDASAANPPADPPDEERDEESDEDAPSLDPAADKPKTKSRAWVYLLVGGLLFAALAGPLLFYFLVWRYQPTAVKHIPAGTHLAVRMDAQELYLFKPFRERVLGALDDAPGVQSRSDRLKKLTGIDLRSDLREIVLASPDGQRWVLLLGGRFDEARFNRADVVHGLRKFLEEQGMTGLTDKDGVLSMDNGLHVAQASDSTVVVANDPDLLRASLQPSDEWTNFGLVGSGAISFAVDQAALDHLKTDLSGFEDAAVFGHTKRITGYLKLGGNPQLSMELVPRGTDSETLAKETETAIGDLKFLAMFLPDYGGEQAMLGAAKTRPRADSVMVTADWPVEGLDRGMKRIGDGVSDALGKKAP